MLNHAIQFSRPLLSDDDTHRATISTQCLCTAMGIPFADQSEFKIRGAGPSVGLPLIERDSLLESITTLVISRQVPSLLGNQPERPLEI